MFRDKDPSWRAVIPGRENDGERAVGDDPDDLTRTLAENGYARMDDDDDDDDDEGRKRDRWTRDNNNSDARVEREGVDEDAGRRRRRRARRARTTRRLCLASRGRRAR